MRIKNLIKIGKAAVGWNLFNLKLPLNVVLSVTNRCNLNCIYCNCNNRNRKELSTKQITNLIDQMVMAGTRRLGLFGGEPLLREDIGEIIDNASNRGLLVSLITNGFLVKDKIEKLKNLDLIFVSLDGPEEMHDRDRGAGSFRKAIEAVKVAQKKKIPVWTIMTLTKNNIGGIDYIVRLARDMNFRAAIQFLYHNDHLGRNRQSLLPSREDCIGAIEKILFYKKLRYPIISSSSYLSRLLKWPDFSQNIIFGPFGDLRCIAGKLYCSVDTDGTVYPCSVLIGSFAGRSFLDAGFSDAFYSLDEPRCSACLSSCMIEQSLLFSLDKFYLFECAKNINVFLPRKLNK